MLLGAEGLLWQELRLHTGQANDAFHEVRIALANKAMLFRTDVHHASSYATTSRAWERVNAVDAVLSKHAAIYRRCRRAMVNLGVDEDVLTRYQLLKDAYLKITAAAATPNSRGNRNDRLTQRHQGE
jgi:hypothetical protein